MKPIPTKIKCLLIIGISMFVLNQVTWAQQDSTAVVEEALPAKPKPVKNTFQSIWIIDNQTVMVPLKHTMEFDILHRFGTVNKGYEDFYGMFASSNIRLGMNYTPIDDLNVGIGLTKDYMLLDFNAKYALLKQTPGSMPVSLSYYVNMGYSTKEDPTLYDGTPINNRSDRLSYFHQLLIARKINNKLSLQVAPSLSYQNAVSGYYSKNDSSGQEVYKSMENAHFAVAVSARYKLSTVMSLMVNYDQPLTTHPSNNPNPNLSFGLELTTSSHSFQLFMGNYYLLSPQRNNLYNSNAPFAYDDMTKTHPNRMDDDPATPADESTKVKGGRFLIGFNITRLWNY
jgi:hypothetical protein